ncbi:hypothetical protein E3N88_15924 [Mikania micrantha]|uniref:Uncharacterized protein n=1 Tax=Mikania micrantha TaxID=192012 RepID=A0A5N6NWZ8_9ASTR|nr:hypothetical protein E3N88_15924 [Mikania micrantha]
MISRLKSELQCGYKERDLAGSGQAYIGPSSSVKPNTSLRCTESFMRDNVMEEMQQLEPGDDTKLRMLDILKRFHSEEEAESMIDDDDGSGDSALSEETIQKIMAGTQLVQPIAKHESDLSDHTHEIPPGPETALPPVSKLSSTEPSPLLAIHLVDILYSYCFTLRLYNGDWESDPVDSATVFLTISLVLGQSGQPETISEVLSHCLEQTCSPAFRHMGGPHFGLGILDDVASLLSLGGDGLICALCDTRRMLKAGLREVKMEKTRDVKRTEMKAKLKSGERKVYFLMCWVHEQPQEGWSSLAGLVTSEKNATMGYMGDIKGGWKAQKKEDRKGKVMIEEVLEEENGLRYYWIEGKTVISSYNYKCVMA